MERNPDQSSISDYSSSGSNPQRDGGDSSPPAEPPEDDPVELLTWLRDSATPMPSTVTDRLPQLIDSVRREDHSAWSAGQCINIILDEHPGIENPDLVAVIDSQYVDTMTVVRELEGIYPRDAPAIEYSLNLDLESDDDLSHDERMVVYRILSRLPPGEEIYNELRKVSDIFDGEAQIGGEVYPINSYFQTYSMRCLNSYLHDPQQAPEDCAQEAIYDHPWSALRLVAAYPEQAVEQGLVQDLIDAIDGKSIPPEFHHGRVISTVVSSYLEAKPQDRQQLGRLIQSMLASGVYPTRWESSVSALIDLMQEGREGGHGGAVLAAIIDAVSDEVIDDSLIREFEPVVRNVENARSAQEVREIGSLLESLKIYPPPQGLRSLYGSSDEDIDRAAKKAVANLRRQFQETTPALAPGDIEDIQALSEEYSLVRRTGDLTWESPELASVELSLLSTIAQITLVSTEEGTDCDRRIKDILANFLDIPRHPLDVSHNSIQLIAPSYDSEWLEFAVLGVAFAQIVNPDCRVMLHTPATGGWGTKKDIKDALQQYAIAPSDDHSDIVPLLDLIPTGRINDGNVVIESTGTTVSDDPPVVTLVRDIESLAGASADIVLYNYLPGIDAVNAAYLQDQHKSGNGDIVSDVSGPDSAATKELRAGIADHASLANLIDLDDTAAENLPSMPRGEPMHIEMYSVFSMQFAAERRQHIGPPTDIPAPIPVTSPEGFNDGSVEESSEIVHEAIELTTGQSQVDLHAVETQHDIGDLLNTVEEYGERVNNSDHAAALRGFRYTIGSLPVPVELHDSWVQNQIDQGNKWVPRQIHDRRNRIESLVDDADIDAQLLDEATITIDTVLDRLAETNPLSEELIDVLDNAAAEGKQVGILCHKKTYKDMLDIFLKDRASDWVLGDDLRLLDEHTVRELSPGDVDWLVTFGPLPPQTAIYYHHPAVEKTVVLGHADTNLEARVYGVERKRRPFFPPEVEAELPEIAVTIKGSAPDVSEEDKSLTDDLYRTYLSVAAQSDGENSHSGSSGEIARYRLQFEDDETATLSNTHPMIVRSEQHLVSSGEFVLRSLSRISPGDEMVYIEPEARRDLWEEFLRVDWEDDDESVDAEESFLDAVELWYEAVSRGLKEHSDTEDPSEGIWDFAREIESRVSVATDTIADWAESVYQADSPSDLVFRSDLRIGPRHADGIEAVATVYGNQRMEENWNQVFTRIKTIRATHRQRGSVFWEWLADSACEGKLFDQPGVRRVTVIRRKKIG